VQFCVIILFQDWSMKKVFGRMVSSTCSLATTSSVYVDISSNEVGYVVLTHIVYHELITVILY